MIAEYYVGGQILFSEYFVGVRSVRSGSDPVFCFQWLDDH
jgi:hypothetical protein